MAVKKIDLWNKVKVTEIPDELTVDPLEVLFEDRLQKAYLFDDQDEREHDECYKVYDEKFSELKATLSVEQMELFCDVDRALSNQFSVEVFAGYKHGFRDGVLLMFRTILRASLDDGHGKDALGEITDKVLNLAK